MTVVNHIKTPKGKYRASLIISENNHIFNLEMYPILSSKGADEDSYKIKVFPNENETYFSADNEYVETYDNIDQASIAYDSLVELFDDLFCSVTRDWAVAE